MSTNFIPIFRITCILGSIFKIFNRAFALDLVLVHRLVGGLAELVDVGGDLLRVNLVAFLLLLLLLKGCLNMTVKTHALLEHLVVALYLFLVRVYILGSVPLALRPVDVALAVTVGAEELLLRGVLLVKLLMRVLVIHIVLPADYKSDYL